jgi:hypothetical protein
LYWKLLKEQPVLLQEASRWDIEHFTNDSAPRGSVFMLFGERS